MRADNSARSYFKPLKEGSVPGPGRRRFIIDDVSDDIRLLEEYFQKAAPRLVVQIEFHDTGIVAERGEDLDSYAGPIVRYVESVGWETLDGEWHLTYLKTKRQGVMTPMGGNDGPTFDHSEVLEHCPLINAPAIDRVRAHRALPELLQEAGTLIQ